MSGGGDRASPGSAGSGATRSAPEAAISVASSPSVTPPDAWQPIETAPRDGSEILVGDFKETDVEDHCYGVVFWREGKWTDGLGPAWAWSGEFYPTHWMPLPSPPEQGK